jgi:hypothetical protein
MPLAEMDHRSTPCAQRARVVGLVDNRRRMAHGLALLEAQPVLAAVRVVDARRVGGHRAVEVDRQVVDDAALLEQVDAVHQVLRAAHREGRDHDDTAARRRAVDDLAELEQRIARVVLAVAGEQDRAPAVVDLHEGGPPHVPRRVYARLQA